ncbi:tyrosine-type recombinase/integrase [Rhodopirellula bahusiensis]|uniref:Integrase n=2 Tax=Rhodopirellula TaxID=265488 RepID=A0A2G1W9B6_9BACT|nr:tyrosine-type recombinase/integrase [Rhodopirellula bahusiensis]PHQ35606.1 integrase [Rhodopirellula bahusiensis]
MPNPIAYKKYNKTAYLFRFNRPDTGKRTTLRLGVVSKSVANDFGQRIDEILECNKYQTDLSPKLYSWLSKLEDETYDLLVRAGLLAARQASTLPRLKVFLDDYRELKKGGGGRSGGWKPGTSNNRKQSADDLVRYFGEDKALHEISAGDAEDWFQWMQKPAPKGRGLSAATASKKLKDARQFFRYAVKKKLIDENPFEDLRIPTQDNPDRLVEVTRETVQKLIDAFDDPEFKLVLALARFAGLRVPSEVSCLTWDDIDFDEETMRVFASKTEHHSRGGHRICPLLPELVPYLQAVRPADAKHDDFVFRQLRGPKLNLRTPLLRKIESLKMEPWPKLFQNLRANALTDLAEEHPIHKVCRWLGNTVDVAMRHYVIIKKREYDGPRQDRKNR